MKSILGEAEYEANLEDWKAEGLEEGRREGLAEGHREGRAEGLEEGRKEGLKEGRAEGLKEGRAEGIENVARKLKAEGAAVELIMSATGLSRADLEKL